MDCVHFVLIGHQSALCFCGNTELHELISSHCVLYDQFNLVLSSAEMANQTEDPPIASAELVGTAFVQQYYTILNQSPHDVYKFYAKESLLSRPESDGSMTTVETVQVSLL